MSLYPFDNLIALMPFGIVGLISWAVWFVRWIGSRRYRPFENSFRMTTSVVVPSFREDPAVVQRCLESWLENNPNEIILVIDLADKEVLSLVYAYAKRDRRVCPYPFKHDGKRSALGAGIRSARFDIVVLTDSDTEWAPELIKAIQMPFMDPAVGGVGTRQNAVGRTTSVWRIAADWMVNTRYLDYLPSQGMAGGVACLSGRTAAYRRIAILPLVGDLENEYFMGRKCIAGDDGRLTWLVLAAGYKTVYQSTARAWSMFPNSGRAFFKQRIRWGRNSYRCYITSIIKGWLWTQPFVTQLTVLQIMLTPLTMGIALLFPTLAALNGNWPLVWWSLAWLLFSRALRNISHLREHPKDIIYLPMIALLVVIIALPIKLYAFLTMNVHGWLTRQSNSIGGESQSQASLGMPQKSLAVAYAEEPYAAVRRVVGK